MALVTDSQTIAFWLIERLMMDFIYGFFTDFIIRDVLDVAIIAVSIYMALVWFEKARARFMMIGLFILGLIYFIARFFGLYLTTIMFQAFFAVFLIMLVIIFQDELRHFFERVALWGLIRKKRRFTSLNQNIEILANTIANFSRKKIGALIVLKGNDPLDRHVDGGLLLEGVLSQIMLENIFSPHVATHDGAIIIEEGRIVKVGCHLPLSINIQKIGHSGTRHAAALGLSERTDSISLVVSEETGTISIADGDRIRVVKDIVGLRLRLEDFYRKRFPRRGKFFADFLTGHILEKLIAVILSCSLWVGFVQNQEVVRRDFVVPIEYRNLASDWIIGEPKSREATVALSGTERTFYLAKSEEVKISLDMSQVKEGDNEIFLDKDSLRRPSGLSVVSITPHKISLSVYKMLNFNVPVEIETSGRVAYGFEVKEIKVIPEKVSIVVPSILPREKIKITTEVIDLRKLKESKTFTPKIILPAELRFSEDKTPQIKVSVIVEKK